MPPGEFCTLQRALVAGMAMRKKRQVAMGPVQRIKLALLDELIRLDPPASAFEASVAEAVLAVSPGEATGPAQAVASDLLMDWGMAVGSAGFRRWLRQQPAKAQQNEPAPARPGGSLNV
jgi:hypothetical protein